MGYHVESTEIIFCPNPAFVEKPLVTIMHMHMLGTVLTLVDPKTQPWSPHPNRQRCLPGNLRLSPDLIGNLPHERQLLALILHAERVPGLMRTEPALRTDADPLERLLARLAGPFSHKVRSLIYPSLRLLFVLQLPQLGTDTTDDDILVLGQELERLESAGPLGVIFQIEGVDVQILKQLLRNDVVRSLGEVAATDEVASAQVHACMHVLGTVGY